MRYTLSCAVLCLLVSPLLAAPAIYWASDPVQPGDLVLVAGEGFGDKPTVTINGTPVPVLQPTDTGFKCAIPTTLKPGLFTLTVKTADGVAKRDLNRPVIWWWRGAYGFAGGADGKLRLLGRNLAMPGQKTTVTFAGQKAQTIVAKSDGYSVSVRVTTAVVGCRVTINNGYASSAAVTVSVEPVFWEAPLTTRPLDVRDFGADGTGSRDDTAAIQAALNKAGDSDGGLVYFPRGRYQLSGPLTVPRFVTMRGEKRELVALFWPDMPNPPEALIRGTHDFALRDLTIYASNHRNIIQGDLGDKPNAGNVYLHKLRVRADAYRGHLTPQQVDERFRQSLKYSTGGGDTVQVGGDNVVITDCDLYGSGRSLYLSRARNSLVANNQLYNGRWGWYCLEGSDGLIFEHNLLQGADLMSTGGGIANYGTACSRNIYFAYNEMKFCHGWDREVMTTDAGGEAYFGKVASASGAQMTLAEEGKWGGRDWTNGGVFILDGKGAGQWRWLQKWDGRNVTLDRPWDVAPDANSSLTITMFHGRYAFVGNSFTDCGAFQFYGTSIECDVVGNTAARNQGYRALGLHYYGFQPSWYCQFLDNTIAEGNYYHWSSAEDSMLDLHGASHEGYSGPLLRAAAVRGNKLLGNSRINLSGSCANVLITQNQVSNSDTGVFVSQSCKEVLLQDNKFTKVTHEIMDEPTRRKAAMERLAKYLNRPDPVLVLHFEEAPGNVTPDASGDGFNARLEGARIVDGGVQGKAMQFDGTGYLRVDETAVFNAPDLTVDFWAKPAKLSGRYGLIAKRFAGTGCPFVINQTGASIGFEATDTEGKWSHNFGGPTRLKLNEWSRLTVVMKTGQSVRIFVDGKLASENQNAQGREPNTEPLILGREAWGGDPPKGETPGFFSGLMDEVRIWTRALTDAEVAALK